MEYLEEYNITFPSQMHLVFFNDALHHISRICRVLRQPRGNALLVRQTTPIHIRKGTEGSSHQADPMCVLL
jgi:hypothetical protein